jgi:hypothetical protein
VSVSRRTGKSHTGREMTNPSRQPSHGMAIRRSAAWRKRVRESWCRGRGSVATLSRRSPSRSCTGSCRCASGRRPRRETIWCWSGGRRHDPNMASANSATSRVPCKWAPFKLALALVVVLHLWPEWKATPAGPKRGAELCLKLCSLRVAAHLRVESSPPNSTWNDPGASGCQRRDRKTGRTRARLGASVKSGPRGNQLPPDL